MPKKTTRKPPLLSLLGLILCVGLVAFVWLPKPHDDSYSLEFERLGDQGLAFLAQVQKLLQPTDMSLTIVLPD